MSPGEKPAPTSRRVVTSASIGVSTIPITTRFMRSDEHPTCRAKCGAGEPDRRRIVRRAVRRRPGATRHRGRDAREPPRLLSSARRGSSRRRDARFLTTPRDRPSRQSTRATKPGHAARDRCWIRRDPWSGVIVELSPYAERKIIKDFHARWM
ncbi:MAG: hypothetical protein KIS78_22550 [Labilithrix sp.]|nr:hypothetical protein [Labilithrix sp.]